MKKQPTIKELQDKITELERKLSNKEAVFSVLVDAGIIPSLCVRDIEHTITMQRVAAVEEFIKNNVLK